jgi:class 3 adenylate cyclase/YHS domain-containing protein
MEQDLAFLIADLSGYTALTETHGSSWAADLIDKYLHIVQNCLVGNCELKERTGDEVMIVSTSPDDLLAAALNIMQASLSEENFLQVHGGLHYGKVLKRHNGYFGSTINVTSRIAAKATPGNFWCSQNFVQALSNKTMVKVEPKGMHHLKNISGEMELFEIKHEHSVSYFIDPVCRMLIINTNKAIRHHDAPDIFFCSDACHAIYTTRVIPTMNS